MRDESAPLTGSILRRGSPPRSRRRSVVPARERPRRFRRFRTSHTMWTQRAGQCGMIAATPLRGQGAGEPCAARRRQEHNGPRLGAFAKEFGT
jgi:hypothetical protein